jgi:hypothetical protein
MGFQVIFHRLPHIVRREWRHPRPCPQHVQLGKQNREEHLRLIGQDGFRGDVVIYARH